MVICPGFKNGICLISSTMKKENVFVDDIICEACKKTNSPMGINTVTCYLARNKNQNKTKEDWDEHINKSNFKNQIDNIIKKKSKKLEDIMNENGVGSQLWRLLERLGINHNVGCGCLDWAERMNLWGPELCDKNRTQIIDHMKNSAKNYGWGDISLAVINAIKIGIAFRLSILDPYGSLLDEAIRLAKDAEDIVKKKLIDIVIPLGTASKYKNIEIKMALRSIERYLIGYRKIIIISPQIPKFFYENDRLQLVQKKEDKCNKQSRVQRKIQWAIENLDITDDFAYWNDDFLVLKPFDVRYIPNYISGNISLAKQNSGWRESKRRTGQILKDSGKTIYNFDIHVPLIFNKEKHLQIKEWWWKPSSTTPLMRSLYGNNFCENNIQQLRDIKLQQKWTKAINNILSGDRWVISYGDGALKTGFGQWMQTFFPVPSSFEQTNISDYINCDKRKKRPKKDNSLIDFWKKLHQDKIND